MIFILVVFTAVTLPFVIIEDDRIRRRIYMLFSAVPVSISLLMYLRAYNGYSIIVIGLFIILPLSLILTAVGVVLVLNALSRKEAWGGLALATLLASTPVSLIIVIQIWNHFRPSGG
ncbi:MAG TPA: hypothetical protein VJ842_07435 [Pyrinomonadaceae bacterium]|nr:hypothetical protein [Pyrinomonadaceae bacterium]